MGYYRHSISQAGNRESECELGSMSSRYGFSTGLEGESPCTASTQGTGNWLEEVHVYSVHYHCCTCISVMAPTGSAFSCCENTSYTTHAA